MKSAENTVAIIQARMGSSRLPGKILEDIAGKPMLERVIDRVCAAQAVNRIVLATTTEESDDAVAALGKKSGIEVFRGGVEDVLDRFYQAAEKFEAKTIVRVTADCPLMDPAVIDRAVELFTQGPYDYVSTADPKPTFPDGQDVWVVSFKTLETAWKEAQLSSEREHVMPYIYNHPEKFRIGMVKSPQDLSHLRWTVDERKDLEFVRQVYGYLGNGIFGINDVLRLLEQHPELSRINAGIVRNEGYQKSLQKDKTV